MKLKHLYMLGAVALMTASCNEDRFLDLKPQGSLNEDIMTSTEGADLLVNAAYAALGGPRDRVGVYGVILLPIGLMVRCVRIMPIKAVVVSVTLMKCTVWRHLIWMQPMDSWTASGIIYIAVYSVVTLHCAY
ncbi:hypothetical protein NXU89_10715 [Bacteroides uniformis]|nr:hypothetical protein [Bacteroides uniformis]